MQLALITGLWMMWTPILSAVAYDSGLYENANLQTKAIIDALWSFGIGAIPVIGYAGNVLWYFNALKKQEAVEV